MGVDGRTQEEIVKWNLMTALRFQTEGRYQTSLVSLLGEELVLNVESVKASLAGAEAKQFLF